MVETMQCVGRISKRKPVRQRAYRVLTRASARSRSVERVVRSAAKQVTVFTYEAAAVVTGLSIPSDQAKFLITACGVQNFVLTATNKVLVAVQGRIREFVWPKALSEKQCELPALLRRLGRAAARGSSAADWRLLMARMADAVRK